MSTLRIIYQHGCVSWHSYKVHLGNYERKLSITYIHDGLTVNGLPCRNIYIHKLHLRTTNRLLMLAEIKSTKYHTRSKRNSGFTKSSKYMVSGARSQSAMDLWVAGRRRRYCSRRGQHHRNPKTDFKPFSPLLPLPYLFSIVLYTF